MKKLFLALSLFAVVFALAACGGGGGTTPDPDPVDATAPTILGAEDIRVLRGTTFAPLAGVTATDEIDGPIVPTVVGTVNMAVSGVYQLTYVATNSAALTTTVVRVVTVSDYMPTTGTFNYRYASADLRHTFFAAAERYLMLTMDAGVPLFANAGFVMYSTRLQLASEQFLPVLGFGIGYSTFTEDDTLVLMEDGLAGNVGEYTYRTTLSTNPTTMHQWRYDDAVSSDVITMFIGSLYYYKFNATMDGYELAPSMAAAAPQPIDSEISPTGVELANKWQIQVRNDMVWTYHPDTDTDAFPVGHEIIDASSFVDTFKLALDEGWFRAISGGGHFWAPANEIVGARNYYDDLIPWEEVGIKLISDYVFEFEFKDQMSEWAVKYWLSSFVMTPVNIALWDAVGAAYGSNPTTTAYNAAYQLDYYETDVILRMSKNPNFFEPNRHFYTHYTFRVIEEAEIRFQEFLAGKLEAGAVTTAQYPTYATDPRLRRIPGATTFRLMINGLGTVEAQQAKFPGSTFVPEPILANQFFKNAMFFAIDREYLALDVMKTSQTQMYLFTDAYLVEPESGLPFRNTPQAETVGVGLSPATNGYDFDTAKALYSLAINELVAAGTYPSRAGGTAGQAYVVELELLIFSGSEAQVLFGNYIKAAFEAAFGRLNNDHNIRVQINIAQRDFPGIYYDYMMIGRFDISIGGISGSTLNAASFLGVYRDDNGGGFTLNWGINTSEADIEIEYFNPYLGAMVKEVWSFNAIHRVLNGTVYIVDGVETTPPAAE